KGLMSVVCGVGLGASAWACDLPSKDIGVEDTATSGATEGGGDTETASSGGECQPGDMMDAPDGCNTCYCTEAGLWACTGIGCVDTDGGPDLPTPCQPGQSVPAGDGCNECVCQDDGETWACTLLGCETEGDTGEPPGGDPFDNNGLEVCGPDVPTDEL